MLAQKKPLESIQRSQAINFVAEGCNFAHFMIKYPQSTGVPHGRQERNGTAMERYSASEQETEAIGREMAQRLAPGAVVAFTGDLGAGKTAFVRGMAQGLGISQRVTSPTFTIVNEYEGGTLPLFHFDMYRLRDADDLFDIGWEDFLRRGGVCAVEWSETIQEALEPDTIYVDIRRGAETNQRILTIRGPGW